jgi:hypothetical protein
MNVQSLLESANPWTDRQNEATKLVSKWERTGLLKNLAGETDKNNMSVILENQAKSLVQEANITGGQTSMSGGAGENWAGVALPLVRRIFGEIVAKEFVSVQPMSLPSGLVFYLDFKYSNLGMTSGGTNSGKAGFGTASLYGNQAERHPNVQNLDVAGGLYGSGKFGYSINTTSSLVVASATSSAAPTIAQYNYNSAASASVGSTARLITLASGSLPLLDVQAVKAIQLVSGSGANSIGVNQVISEFTTLNSDGTIQFIVSGSTLTATLAGTAFTVVYPKYTTVDARGDFEDAASGYPNSESGTAISIPSVDIKLKSEAIVAKTRRLKAQWTPEFAQDLNAYHSVDAESEITSMISNYIAMEVDLELLGMLTENAATTGYWSAANNTFWNGTSFTTVNTGTTSGNLTGYYNSQGEWFQTIGTVLQTVSNKIHQKTLRGGANFLVVSPAVATVLESIPGFATDSSGDKDNFNFGIQKIGSLNSRYKIYKNPYLTSNLILMGYKGGQFLETGAVYAPYIPLIMTPLVYDPATFTPRKGLMTRYAKKMVRPEFYGKVLVHGLETLGF